MVKKIVILLAVLIGSVLTIFFFTSSPTVIKFPKSQLVSSQKQEVEKLFNKNLFSITNLLPYEIDKNNMIGKTRIKVYQIYQGVPVNEELILHFDSNTGFFISVSGHPVPNIPISTDKIVNNADLVSKTMKIIGEDNSHYLSLARPINISVQPMFHAKIAAFKARLDSNFWGVKSPLTAQLYIYNKNSGTDNPQDWTMAWIIKPKNQSDPIFIMDANTGQTLWSFNGVVY